jgi:hypothetical protein
MVFVDYAPCRHLLMERFKLFALYGRDAAAAGDAFLVG